MYLALYYNLQGFLWTILHSDQLLEKALVYSYTYADSVSSEIGAWSQLSTGCWQWSHNETGGYTLDILNLYSRAAKTDVAMVNAAVV